MNFATGTRHIRAVSAVEACDRAGTLADGSAHAVHRGVAAADDDDILVLRIQSAVLEGWYCIAETLPIGRDQKLERRDDIA